MTSTICKSAGTHLDTVVTGLRFLTAAFIGHADTHMALSNLFEQQPPKCNELMTKSAGILQRLRVNTTVHILTLPGRTSPIPGAKSGQVLAGLSQVMRQLSHSGPSLAQFPLDVGRTSALRCHSINPIRRYTHLCTLHLGESSHICMLNRM